MISTRVDRICAGVLFFVACGCSERPEEPESREVISLRQALETTSQLELPEGAFLSTYALGARGSLRINDDATVTGLSFNAGTLETNVGVDTTVGSLTSVSSVELRDRAHVQGDVISAGSIVPLAGVTVDGDILPNQPVATSARSVTVDFGDQELGNVDLQPGQLQLLSPGSYGFLSVKPGSAAQLSAGKYYFSTVFLDTGGELRIDGAGGPVFVLASDTVTLRGDVVPVTQWQPALLLGAFGAGGMQVDTSYSGALFAPNGKINLQSGGPFSGQAYAQAIELHQTLRFDHDPFFFWQDLLDPPPPEPTEPLAVETIASLLPQNEIGQAIQTYIDAAFASTSAAARANALLALRSLPATDVVDAIGDAFNASSVPNNQYALLFTLNQVNSPEALPFLDGLLQKKAPEGFIVNGHSNDAVGASKVLIRAVVSVEYLYRAGVPGAGDVLLSAATTHDHQPIRAWAIERIVEIGDPELIDDLEESIRPEDETHLQPKVPLTADSIPTIVPGDQGDEGVQGTPPGEPSCSDGLQNQGEEGIDCGGPCPPCPDECQPVTYEAEDMFHSVGGPAPEGWNIWANGYVATGHTFETGNVTISVVARGEFANGLWPHMVVSVGGAVIGDVTVDSPDWDTYGFPFSASAGSHEIRVAFDNDYDVPPADRNLIVDKVIVGCPVGGGGPSGCTESGAVDMGVPGNEVTVSTNGCLRVLDGYPSWWDQRTMKLETTSGGTYPVDFTWTTSCAGSGSGSFSADWQSQLLTPTDEGCATVIDLLGSGVGTVALRYYAS